MVGLWTWAGRGVLGVPNDVLAEAGQALRRGETGGAVLLLDWLSLQLPRWRLGPVVGAVMTALITCLLSVLAILGFRWQFEMAQALTLLGVPFAVLLVLKLRLAGQLDAVIEAARLGRPAPDAAAEAMARINRYRFHHTVISLLAVTVTAFWAARWIALHPFGV